MPARRPRIQVERRSRSISGTIRVARWWRWVVCFVFAALTPTVARSAETERDIEVSIAGDRETSVALQSEILEFASGRDVRVSWNFKKAIEPREVLAPPPADSTAFARIWLDVRASERAVLYLADTTSDRYLVRVVPLQSGYDEVARESLRNIVESAIDALLAGAEIGVSREAAEEQVAREVGPMDPEPPKQEEAAPPPRRRASPRPTPRPDRELPPFWGGFLGYRAETLRGAEALRHGPEVGGVLAGREAVAPAVTLSLGYRVPSEWQGDEVSLRWQGAGARATFGLRARFEVLRLYLGAGLGFEAMRVSTTAQAAGVAPREPLWATAPIALGSLGAGVQLSRRLELSLNGAAELDLLGNHFDVIRSQRSTPVLEPWRVHPAATLALLVELGAAP